MSVPVIDQPFREVLWKKLKTFRRDEILAAVELSGSFPAPSAGGDPQDMVAQTIHDIALHAECLSDWELCKTLYRRVLQYPVERVEIHADARFRLAHCLERQGAYTQAVRAYRDNMKAESGSSRPLQAHTRLRLARLLMDAEDFPAAFALLDEVAAWLPVERLDSHEVLHEFGRCALRVGREEAAVDALHRALDATPGTESEVEMLRLLAAAYEQTNQPAQAVECYRRIVSSGFSEPRTKAAATVRLQALGSR